MNSLFRLLGFVAVLAACQAAGAAELFGSVDALSGSASVSGPDGSATPVAVGLKLYEGDTVSSGHDGEVHIVTEDGGIIALRPDTVFRVDAYKAEGGADDKTFMSLQAGAVRSVTGWIGKHDNSAYRLSTPTVTIGIRGTDHEVTVIDKGDGDEPGTYETVNEGATVMKTSRGETEVAPGKYAFAPRGDAVAPRLLAQRPRFLAARSLKMEERIQQRKEFMRGRFEQMRSDRIQHVGQARAERTAAVGAPARAHVPEGTGQGREERRDEWRRQRQEARDHRRQMTHGGARQEGNPQHHRQRGHLGRERE